MDSIDGGTESKDIDFAVFGERLNKLLTATGNKLSREWPAKYQAVKGAREIFIMHLRTAQITYLSALYLGGDIPPDPRRKPEFCATLPVLNRSLLDSLFSLLFIIEDLPSRCQWYWEADWRETRLVCCRVRSAAGMERLVKTTSRTLRYWDGTRQVDPGTGCQSESSSRLAESRCDGNPRCFIQCTLTSAASLPKISQRLLLH